MVLLKLMPEREDDISSNNVLLFLFPQEISHKAGTTTTRHRSFMTIIR
jgi:hypothetical protein